MIELGQAVAVAVAVAVKSDSQTPQTLAAEVVD